MAERTAAAHQRRFRNLGINFVADFKLGIGLPTCARSVGKTYEVTYATTFGDAVRPLGLFPERGRPTVVAINYGNTPEPPRSKPATRSSSARNRESEQKTATDTHDLTGTRGASAPVGDHAFRTGIKSAFALVSLGG
jgi:hypothetical protein